MAEKIVKTVDCGLGITLDLYSGYNWEYTFPAVNGADSPLSVEVQKATMENPMFAYQAATAAVNRYLAANGLPPVNEPLVK